MFYARSKTHVHATRKRLTRDCHQNHPVGVWDTERVRSVDGLTLGESCRHMGQGEGRNCSSRSRCQGRAGYRASESYRCPHCGHCAHFQQSGGDVRLNILSNQRRITHDIDKLVNQVGVIFKGVDCAAKPRQQTLELFKCLDVLET